MPTQIRSEQLALAPVLTDPIAPHVGQVWVLKQSFVGQPIGLLLSLTQATLARYYLSYQTDQGTILRVQLT